ncbi:hypothetical protein NM208_g2495 [Fusarium decemcellulare]|uniref:Uncharacterized protein n=1 Tax=Fusarium decemcellulare TaxID=57161 RepID=A0ACC1SSF6_9HYPO|nr:hypothetical protein NM208_g2495 [Fusarium decemcellulare]
MHLLILGATGKAGQFGYKYALEQGHDVTVIVRDASSIPQHENLTVVIGSVLVETVMDRAFQALDKPVDAVLQFLNPHRETSSPWSKFIGPPRLLADATASAARALRQQGTSTERKPRLVVMNALGVGESRKVTPWITRMIIDHSNVGKTYEDHTAVDAEIEKNCGDQIIWTVALAVGLGQAGLHPVKTFSPTESGASWTITPTMFVSQLFCRPEFLALIFTVTFYFALQYFIHDDQPYPGFPIIGSVPGDWFGVKTKKRWETHAVEIMQDGDRESKGRPFQVLTNLGPTIVLPKQYCDEIRNDSRLSFRGFIERQGMTDYPGLDVVHTGTQDDIIQTAIRKNLNQALGGLTQALSSECKAVLKGNLQSTKDWKETKFIMTATQIAARLSARVFLGERLCHNKDWIEISIRFTVVMMKAQDALRSWPLFLRPFVHYFIPELIYLKRLIRDARKIIEPELEIRMAARPEVTKPEDSLSWLDDVRAGRPFDVVSGQLFLTVAAIHTTSVVMTALMYDLVKNPEYIDLLRQEAISVYAEDKEWRKSAVEYSWPKRAEDSIILSDGIFIPKGAHITMPTYHMRDPKVFGVNADRFDGHRFLRMRQRPGEENRWQFVSTSPEFLSFGHGTHACPGRFFASNEIKIAMVQLLLNFDWRVAGNPPESRFASRFVPDPATLVAYRSRIPEIKL